MDIRSPYRTAPGSEPPELAGREAEIAASLYALEMTAAGEPANPIVYLGLRGMGKTALLREMARKARDRGGLTLLVEADRELRFSDVLRNELTGALERSESMPNRLRKSLGAIVTRLPKLTFELPHDAGALAISDFQQPAADLNDGLETQLLELNTHLRREKRFLMIGLDEIQEASRRDLLRIIRVVHETAGTDSPIMFVGAGLPSSPAILHTVRTYTERWAKYRLGLLDRNDTFAAIERPASLLGRHWTAGALASMYDITSGYPFFIQQFAFATWQHAKGNDIDERDIEAIVPGVRSLLDASLYDPQFAQLTPREAKFVLALHELGDGTHRMDEIAKQLGAASSAEIGSARARLTKKDVVFSAVRGEVEFRMPLANDYIRRRYDRIASLAASG